MKCLENANGSNGTNQNRSNAIEVSDSSYKLPQPAIYGGYEATMAEFPYAVRLYLYAAKALSQCTGQAIHPHLIITAAHCVVKDGPIIVVTGNADQTDYTNGKNVAKYARYRVTEVFVHPKFDANNQIHDVAILKLGRDMIHEGRGYINISYDKITEPVNATIIGWGGTEITRRNNKLFGKHIMIRNCTLSPSRDFDYLCLMDKGIFHGDSGGGLIINGSLYGVASFILSDTLLHPTKNHSYFYTALWEEELFLRDVVAKNGINYISPLQFFIFGSFTLILFFSNNYILL